MTLCQLGARWFRYAIVIYKNDQNGKRKQIHQERDTSFLVLNKTNHTNPPFAITNWTKISLNVIGEISRIANI